MWICHIHIISRTCAKGRAKQNTQPHQHGYFAAFDSSHCRHDVFYLLRPTQNVRHDVNDIGEYIPLYGNPDSKVHGANMGPIWGRQDPGGPHAGPMNFAIWELFCFDWWFAEYWLHRPSCIRLSWPRTICLVIKAYQESNGCVTHIGLSMENRRFHLRLCMFHASPMWMEFIWKNMVIKSLLTIWIPYWFTYELADKFKRKRSQFRNIDSTWTVVRKYF